MLLPRTRLNIDEPLYLDGWAGYPASLHGLLAQICDERLQNLVFLSGDAHLACNATVTVQKKGEQPVTFTSHHAPALYAPFPFANENRWNLVLDDCFDFTCRHEGRPESAYHCTVQARLPARLANGFSLLKARRTGGKWTVRARVIKT